MPPPRHYFDADAFADFRYYVTDMPTPLRRALRATIFLLLTRYLSAVNLRDFSLARFDFSAC